MGRPDQGNKAQTLVGYSHDTGVSTSGPATAVPGVVARDTPGVHRFVWGLQTSYRRCGACVATPPGHVARGCGSSLEAPEAAKCAKRIATA